MKQTLLLLLMLFGGIAVAAYILIFSRQAEIEQLIDTTNNDTSVSEVTLVALPQDASSQPVVIQDPNTFETTRYYSADGNLSFEYPSYFLVKQKDTECSFCPELVLENEDDRLWFGTLPPGSENHCEDILQHNELPVGDMTVIWYEYTNSQTEECNQAGAIHGFKATAELGTTIYYLDYLPVSDAATNQQEEFLQMVRSISLHSEN
ncbi:MAG: hypothetical protein GW762_02000 [Candidatus Pacebacteria bacterium]|nr:hypothetical protein [Candidatus Paceibacterota bacterium]PJA69268.1 MAG: hypothetical protein CO156_00015 [Candidatus Pacebacteria bacterium CG_4_9_14_3_um_filter_40_12]